MERSLCFVKKECRFFDLENNEHTHPQKHFRQETSVELSNLKQKIITHLNDILTYLTLSKITFKVGDIYNPTLDPSTIK